MVYQKVQRDLDLSKSIANTESSIQHSVMRIFKSFVAACVLSMAKAGYYLSFNKTQRPEYILSNKRYTVVYAVRCLGLMSLFAYLSHLLLGAHHHVFDVQRIGMFFDYIVP